MVDRLDRIDRYKGFIDLYKTDLTPLLFQPSEYRCLKTQYGQLESTNFIKSFASTKLM